MRSSAVNHPLHTMHSLRSESSLVAPSMKDTSPLESRMCSSGSIVNDGTKLKVEIISNDLIRKPKNERMIWSRRKLGGRSRKRGRKVVRSMWCCCERWKRKSLVRTVLEILEGQKRTGSDFPSRLPVLTIAEAPNISAEGGLVLGRGYAAL